MNTKHNRSHRPQARQTEVALSPAFFVRRVATALSITVALGALLLVALSLVAYMTPDPDALVMPLGLIVSATTAFFGGMIAVRVHHRRAPLPAAMINAALLSALMLILSLPLATYASGYSALLCALLHAAVFALSALGAIIAARPPKPTRGHKHLHRA